MSGNLEDWSEGCNPRESGEHGAMIPDRKPSARRLLVTGHKRGKLGRSDRIRTYDPLVPNEVRYQTALHSDMAACGVGGL